MRPPRRLAAAIRGWKSRRRGWSVKTSCRGPGARADSLFWRLTQLIADTAHGLDELARGVTIHLLAQVIDVDVDHVGHGVKGEIPDVLHDHGARDAAAAVT